MLLEKEGLDLNESFIIDGLERSESVLSNGGLQFRVESLHLSLVSGPDLILNQGENFLLQFKLLTLLVVLKFERGNFKVRIYNLIGLYIIIILRL